MFGLVRWYDRVPIRKEHNRILACDDQRFVFDVLPRDEKQNK
jgi:hypothetical protein